MDFASNQHKKMGYFAKKWVYLRAFGRKWMKIEESFEAGNTSVLQCFPCFNSLIITVSKLETFIMGVRRSEVQILSPRIGESLEIQAFVAVVNV